MSRTFIVTGGAGFIGSAVARHLIADSDDRVVVVDKLTYAGNLDNLAPIAQDERFSFVKADICDAARMRDLVAKVRPDAILHLAAESHVDRSIDAPGEFITTNVIGTFVLLQAALEHWRTLPLGEKQRFRFHHVSTDEVVRAIVALMDRLAPDEAFDDRSRLITFVADRPGHDARYAIDAAKIGRELGWRLRERI
jgi:dTDP-glucose 4,6-dehydratase